MYVHFKCSPSTSRATVKLLTRTHSSLLLVLFKLSQSHQHRPNIKRNDIYYPRDNLKKTNKKMSERERETDSKDVEEQRNV